MVLKGLHCSSTAASNSLVIHSPGSGSLYTEICLTGGCQVLSLSRPRKQEGGAGRTLTYISLPDVFHADDPHCQQIAWRWSLLLVKRKVKSPLKDHLETAAAGEASSHLSPCPPRSNLHAVPSWFILACSCPTWKSLERRHTAFSSFYLYADICLYSPMNNFLFQPHRYKISPCPPNMAACSEEDRPFMTGMVDVYETWASHARSLPPQVFVVTLGVCISLARQAPSSE